MSATAFELVRTAKFVNSVGTWQHRFDVDSNLLS